MSALTEAKNIDNLSARFLTTVTLPIKNAEIIWAGAMVAVVAGEWQNVTATTGLEGRYAIARSTVDNTADGKRLCAQFPDPSGRWMVPLRNDATSPVTAANLGDEVYFKDNQTVSMDGTGRSKAGRVWKFGDVGTHDVGADETIVWVQVY